MPYPNMAEQLAGYMFIVNPIVCPKCLLRYPRGTKVCNVCGKELPKE
jgi:predicted amidophosphoribosyltransferase